MIPLGIPGCASEMNLMLSDVFLSGSTNDLSAFDVELSEWQAVRCEVDDRQVRIRVGSNETFAATFNEDAGRVVGLRFWFEGAGAVDYVTLSDASGAAVYEETF